MLGRRSNKGFTLVELMVVIGILGILVTVLAVAVLPQLTEAKTKLDAQQLSKFQQQLSLAVGEKRKFIRGINPKKGKGTAYEVYMDMWTGKVLTTDDFGLLAGSSGDSASESDLKSGNIDPATNIIFTGPNTGEKYVSMLSGSMNDGVFMCYNKNWYKEFEEMVVLFPKEKTANPMAPIAIEQQYNQVAKKPAKFQGELSEMDDKFYGKPPFQNVVPE